MREEVSVIMSVYNGEDFLQESIESILNQTYNNFEFIIVNDGSEDRTEEILNNVTDPRVKVYHLDKNYGVSYARNFAIEKAKSKWIVLQDDDDVSLPTRIEEQMGYLKDHPHLISVLSNFQLIKKNTSAEGMPPGIFKKQKGPFFTEKQLKNKRFFCPWICYGSAVISKQAILEAGGYNPRHRLGEDYDLFLRLMELGPIAMVPSILYHYRYDCHSNSRKNRAETRSAIIKISALHIKKQYENKGLQPRFAILGSAEDGRDFVCQICPETGIQIESVHDPTETKQLNKAFLLFEQKRINGIIVLADDKTARRVLRNLINKGMNLNKNLFRLKKFRNKSVTKGRTCLY